MSTEIIQIHYEALDQIAARFQQQSELTAQMDRQVQARLAALRAGGWEGRGSAAFFAEMEEQVLPANGRLTAALAEAAQTVRQIQAILRTAEEEAAALFRATSPPALITKGGSSIWRNFNVAGLLFHGGKLTLDVLLDEKVINLYQLLKDNKLIANPQLMALVESNWFKGGLVGADALFGFLNDLNQGTYGDDYLKAGGVNTIDALIQFGMVQNPVGAVALIANSVLQIGGNLQVGVQRTLGDLFAVDAEMGAMLSQDADALSDAIEKANLGNITKKLSEGIYTNIGDRLSYMADSARMGVQGIKEMWQNPSWQTLQSVTARQWAFQGAHVGDQLSMTLGPAGLLVPTSAEARRSYGEAGLAAVNVVDGLTDWGIASSASQSNLAVSAIAQNVNQRPYVPDFMKHAVAEGAKDLVNWQQQSRDWAIGLIDIGGEL